MQWSHDICTSTCMSIYQITVMIIAGKFGDCNLKTANYCNIEINYACFAQSISVVANICLPIHVHVC